MLARSSTAPEKRLRSGSCQECELHSLAPWVGMVARQRTASPLLRLAFSWQRGRIFVDAFAEAAAHAGGQAYAGFAELVAETVGGCESVLPALLARAFEQVELIGLG